MRKLHRLMAVAGSVALAASVFPMSASAGTGGVIATYKGKQIDLSQDWEGADLCREAADGTVTCYDSAQAPAARGTIDDCPYTYACLWEHSGAEGRRLQWSAKGTKNLADWGFRDKATGAYNHRAIYGFQLTDVRTGLPDPSLYVGVGQYVNLKNESYPYGGNWNDKIDKVALL